MGKKHGMRENNGNLECLGKTDAEKTWINKSWSIKRQWKKRDIVNSSRVIKSSRIT